MTPIKFLIKDLQKSFIFCIFASMDMYNRKITKEDLISLIQELDFLEDSPTMVGDAFMERLDYLIQKYGWN